MSALTQAPIEDQPTRPVSLWRNRSFLLLWSGQIVSAVGTQITMLAFPLLILALTHSPAEAGILGAVRSLPFIILTLPAGVMVDRWDRKRTMIVCDTVRVFALGSIPVAVLLAHLSIVQLAVISLIEGTMFTFFNVAETACLPQVVTKEQLPDAVGLGSTVDSVSILIGPSLSGALYAAGRMLPFLVDAISYGISVISLLFIRTEFQEERVALPRSMWSEAREGMVWLWRRPTLRFLAIVIGTLNLFSMGYPIIMIVRAQELHANSFVIGILFATGGIGSMVGALTIGPLQRRFSVGKIIVVGCWIWSITWIPFAIAPDLFWFAVANVVGWLIVPIVMGTQYGYRLAVIPDELQGRVQSVFKLIAFGSQPISLALTGALVQAFGPIETIWIIFVPQMVLSGIAQLNRSLRQAPRMAEIPHG